MLTTNRRPSRWTLLTLVVMSMACEPRREAQAQPGTAGQAAVPAVAASGARPILVELFTSEGCSSCPPADDLLEELHRKQPIGGAAIIPLEFHVDYWDYIGWKDPFASAEYTARQKRYAAHFRARGIYTPQMVVQGSAEFVGSSGYRARSAILKAVKDAPAAQVSVTAAAGGSDAVEVTVRGLPSGAAASTDDEPEVWLAISQAGLWSQVTRGENSGHKLAHAPIVRRLQSLGVVSGGQFQQEVDLSLDASWTRPQLQAVAFVQARRTGRVLGVAALPLGK
jgi:hypothetical protein